MMAIYVQLKHVAVFTCMKKWCADCNPTSFLYIYVLHNNKVYLLAVYMVVYKFYESN